MTTIYVTFGQKYARETHPVDGRAHPDGWFEYVADTYAEASVAARRHLLHRRQRRGRKSKTVRQPRQVRQYGESITEKGS